MAGAVFGFNTFSIWSWADAYNPEESGVRRRSAALAADSATLHRLPVRCLWFVRTFTDNFLHYLWQLSDRGIGSEIWLMLLAMIYAIETEHPFRLASRGWNASLGGGWTDWFEPFVEPYDRFFLKQSWFDKPNHLLAHCLTWGARHGIIGTKRTILTHDLRAHIWNKDFNSRLFQIPDLGIDGNATHACSVLLRMIWRLKPEIREDISLILAPIQTPSHPYAAIHVRRGDKLKEATHTEIRHYLDLLERERPDLKDVFVATDDFSIIRELRQLSPDRNFITLTGENQSGHLQRTFNRRSMTERKKDTLAIFADIEASKNAGFFIGTWSSNFSRMIGFLRNFEGCVGAEEGSKTDFEPSVSRFR